MNEQSDAYKIDIWIDDNSTSYGQQLLLFAIRHSQSLYSFGVFTMLILQYNTNIHCNEIYLDGIWYMTGNLQKHKYTSN